MLRETLDRGAAVARAMAELIDARTKTVERARRIDARPSAGADG